MMLLKENIWKQMKQNQILFHLEQRLLHTRTLGLTSAPKNQDEDDLEGEKQGKVLVTWGWG